MDQSSRVHLIKELDSHISDSHYFQVKFLGSSKASVGFYRTAAIGTSSWLFSISPHLQAIGCRRWKQEVCGASQMVSCFLSIDRHLVWECNESLCKSWRIQPYTAYFLLPLSPPSSPHPLRHPGPSPCCLPLFMPLPSSSPSSCTWQLASSRVEP